MNQFNISFHEEKRWYEENYECPEEFAHLDEWAPLVKTGDLEECEYKNMRGTFDSYQKLQEEKKALKEEIAHKNEKFCEWIEENKALDNDLRDRCGTVNYLEDIIKEFKKENKALKEENKKLKEGVSETIRTLNLTDSEEESEEEEDFCNNPNCEHHDILHDAPCEKCGVKTEEEEVEATCHAGTDIRRWAPTDILKRLDIKNKKLKEDVEGLQEKLDKGIEEGEKLKEVLAELRKHGTLKPQFYSSEETALKSLITDPKEIFKSELEFVCISGGERLIGPVRKEDSTLKKRMEKLGEAFEDAVRRREEAELKEIMALNDTGDGEIHGF